MKTISAILAFSALGFAATASAQTATWIEIESDEQMVGAFNMTVDQLEDLDLYDMNGEAIGEIEEVLGSQDGTPTAFAAEVGGFLDLGDTDVVIPFDQVTLEGDRLQIDMTEEEVEALERWND